MPEDKVLKKAEKEHLADVERLGDMSEEELKYLSDASWIEDPVTDDLECSDRTGDEY